jgi:hypothetical protein
MSASRKKVEVAIVFVSIQKKSIENPKKIWTKKCENFHNVFIF